MSLLTDKLAAIMLGGEWTRLALLRRVSAAVGLSGSWARAFVNDILSEFPVAPHGQSHRLSSAIGDQREFRDLSSKHELPLRPVRYLLEPREFEVTRHPIPALAGASELCAWLGVPPEWFDWFVDPRGLELRSRDEALKHYRRTWIPKASGGARFDALEK